MKFRKRHWMLRRMILGLAVAAVVAPAAQARVDSGEGGGSSYSSSWFLGQGHLKDVQSSPQVIPYLSQGLSIDNGMSVGEFLRLDRAAVAEPTLAELLFDGEMAIAALDRESQSGVLSLDKKADVFVPSPNIDSGSEIALREVGAGVGIGLVLALCGAAAAVVMSRRRSTIAGA